MRRKGPKTVRPRRKIVKTRTTSLNYGKNFYETEEVLAQSVDEYVAGQSFTNCLERMGSQYLSIYKATTHTTDRFFGNHPLPTKKDIAQVCV